MKLSWHRKGAVSFAEGTAVRYEIDPHRGYDRLRGGDYTEWRLEANEEWVETFSRLKDAKARAQSMEA